MQVCRSLLTCVCPFSGSRFKPTHDFGYVALDIAGLRPEDEGVYSCRARNDLGEAVTTASVRIRCESRHRGRDRR